MKCPKCYHEQEYTVECESCGIIFDKYFTSLANRKYKEAVQLFEEKKYPVALHKFEIILNSKFITDDSIKNGCKNYITKIQKASPLPKVKRKNIPCPYCLEMILPNSSKCKHCLSVLGAVPVSSGVMYAGFWLRVVASMIDSLILNIITFIPTFIIGLIIGGGMAAADIDPDIITAIAGILGGIFAIVVNWLYFTIMESSKMQATVGKRALGLVVTDSNGDRISYGRANGRYWGKIVSALILCIGFIMAGFTEKKQALHDLMADTLVCAKVQLITPLKR